MEDLIIYTIPVAVFVTSLFVGLNLIKRRRHGLAVGCCIAWAGFTAWMFFGMEQASGWDGLTYALALIGLSAPVAAGGVIGGVLGWMKQKKVADA